MYIEIKRKSQSKTFQIKTNLWNIIFKFYFTSLIELHVKAIILVA